MIARVLTILFLILVSAGALSFGFSTLPKVLVSPRLYSWWLGIVAFPASVWLLQRSGRNLAWMEVFSHELTHTIFAALTFRRLNSFVVTSTQGGHITYIGGQSWLVALSPYCIPIFTLFLLFTFPIYNAGVRASVIGLIGFTYAFHLQTFWKQCRPDQSDLQLFTVGFSRLFIGGINLFFIIAIPFVCSRFGAYSVWWTLLVGITNHTYRLLQSVIEVFN